MENHEEIKQVVPETEVDKTELSEDELDEASGGIIVIGGKPTFTNFQSKLNQVGLVPQPLPPKTLTNLGNL